MSDRPKWMPTEVEVFEAGVDVTPKKVRDEIDKAGIVLAGSGRPISSLCRITGLRAQIALLEELAGPRSDFRPSIVIENRTHSDPVRIAYFSQFTLAAIAVQIQSDLNEAVDSNATPRSSVVDLPKSARKEGGAGE